MTNNKELEMLFKPHPYNRALKYEINWIYSDDGNLHNMSITILLSNEFNNKQYLLIECLDIQQLKLNGSLDPNDGLGSVLIRDISANQWGVRYEVIESEDDGFQFYCRDIKVSQYYSDSRET